MRFPHLHSGSGPTFLGWDGPALPRAARILVEAYLGGGREGELDIRRVLVVTPGARAGRRLGELLLAQAEEAGALLVPPRFVTAGGLPELLYTPSAPLADPTVQRHAFARALEGLDPRALETLFRIRPGGPSGWLTLAETLLDLHGRVGGEGLTFREVALAFRRGFPYDDSPRWELLAKVQEGYMEILASQGRADREAERRRALEAGEVSLLGDTWLVGVPELPGVVRRLLLAAADAGAGTGDAGAAGRDAPLLRSLVHAPEELRDRFDPVGCVHPEGWREATIPLEEERIRVCQDPRDQAREVGEVLAGYGGRYRAEEVVVGVPEEELVPYLEQGLTEARVPHRFAQGVRLRDTAPLRLLQALADYLDGRETGAFAGLLRHPDLLDLLDEGGPAGADGSPEGPPQLPADPLTLSDEYQTRHLQTALAGGIPGRGPWARGMRSLVKEVEERVGLDTLEGRAPLSQWMPRLLEILIRVYGARPLDISRRGARQTLEALDRIKGAAGALSALPWGLDRTVEGGEALRVLLAELLPVRREARIPPDPEEEAVELLGWLELALDDAPAVILTGMNDGNVPEVEGADPFLPGVLRTHLGLPDDETRYARDAFLLSTILHSRESLHLLAGRRSAAGDPLRPSRLLFAAPRERVARRVLSFLGEEGEGAHTPPAAATGPEPPATVSRFRSPPDDPIPPLESLPSISVTAFREYLQDPYRFFLNRILRLEPLDDSARELDPGAFGEVAHAVLERFGRSDEAASSDRGVVRGAVNRHLDQVVEERFGPRPRPAVRIQLEQLRARLWSFADWQAGWADQGWRIQAVEAQPPEGVPLEVDGVETRLRGKIDRIDRNLSTGEWAIFDYKTGEAGKEPEEAHRKGRGAKKEWQDLQLPLYRLLLAGVAGEDGGPLVPEGERRRVELGYILLPKELDQVRHAFGEWTRAELAQAEEVARQVVRALRREPFVFQPGPRSRWEDPLDALLGLKELPVAVASENGEEEE